MMGGMTTFTFVHVLLSLIGILSGFIVLYGLIASNLMNRWTSVFLATTLATSVTGFFFPFHGVTPAIVLGVLSIVALAAVAAARYAFHLSGAWRWIYFGGSVLALYFNVFVLVVQAFAKIPALHALAPTEPPSGVAFAVSQGIVLVFFVVAGVFAVRRFRPANA
jgi:hypothetical protein